MTAEPQPVRLFLALPLPEPVVRLLREAQRTLQSRCAGPWIKWARPEQMHLTLKFLGAVPIPQVESLIQALASPPPPSTPLVLRSGQVGCFPHAQRPRVFWLGIEGDRVPLQKAQEWIQQKTRGFGHAAEEHNFTPHLTLGRTNPSLRPAEMRILADRLHDLPLLERVSWTADGFGLIQSELKPTGAVHQTLAQFPLPRID